MRWSRKAMAAPRASPPARRGRAPSPRAKFSAPACPQAADRQPAWLSSLVIRCLADRALFADVTEIEKQHEENRMNGSADAVDRWRHGQMRAEHRDRRAGQIEIEQHARADEERAERNLQTSFQLMVTQIVSVRWQNPAAYRYVLPLKPERACRRTPPCARTCRRSSTGPANGRRGVPSRYIRARSRRRPCDRWRRSAAARCRRKLESASL